MFWSKGKYMGPQNGMEIPNGNGQSEGHSCFTLLADPRGIYCILPLFELKGFSFAGRQRAYSETSKSGHKADRHFSANFLGLVSSRWHVIKSQLDTWPLF